MAYREQAGTGKIFDVQFGQALCDMFAVEFALPCIFVGENGRIVAASIHERIGATHDIAARIMLGEMDEYCVTKEEASKSIGMREGVNMGIDFEGDRLINFGITGPLETVRPLARIIRFCVSSLLRIRQYENPSLAAPQEAPSSDFIASAKFDIKEGARIGGKVTGLNALLDHASETLQGNLSRLRDAIENIDQGIAMFDPALRLVVWNKRFLELVDISEDIVRFGLPLEYIFRFNAERGEYGPADVETQVTERMNSARTQVAYRRERVRPDGRVLEVSGRPLPNGGFVSTYTDITERRRKDTELQAANQFLEQRVEMRTRDLARSEKRFRDLAQSASDWFWETDSELRYTYLSERFYSITGLCEEMVLGKTRRQLVMTTPMGDDPTQWAEHFGDLDAHRPFRDFQYRMLGQGGREVFIRVNGTPHFDEDGSFLGYRGTGANVTEIVAAENELIRSEKLAALGGLVAGIAHEINTPVGTCLTASTLLEEQTKELRGRYQAGDLAQEDLDTFLVNAGELTESLITNLHRAATLVRSFKQVAVDQSSEQRRQFQLRGYIDEVLVSLQPRLKRTKHIIQVSCPDAIAMDSYPGALSQVLTNLVINAMVHGFDGIDQGVISILCKLSDDRVQIIFCDDGRGIPSELLRKVFDPFFTTRRGQGGSGLGLHLVHNLVTSALGGRIDVRSGLGVGTTFILALPLRKEDHHGD